MAPARPARRPNYEPYQSTTQDYVIRIYHHRNSEGRIRLRVLFYCPRTAQADAWLLLTAALTAVYPPPAEASG